MNASNETAAAADNLCDSVDTDFLYERFWICVVVGVTVSVISIVENVFIFALFASNRQHRNSYNLYLTILAIFDVFMGISYIAIMAVNVLINYTSSIWLARLKASYLVPMLAISHIAMTASTFLIVFAAIERYAVTVAHSTVGALQRNRRFFVMTAILIAVFTKGTSLFELVIRHDENCRGRVREFLVEASWLTRIEWFNEYFRIIFRNVTTIFVPFFILLLLNVSLVMRLMLPSREKTNVLIDHQHLKQKRARIRAATRTLVILVFTYLLSNVLSVIINFWEYIDKNSLWTEYLSFYVIAVDSVSVLTIIACALRLPIYLSCQPLLRKEAAAFVASFVRGCSERSDKGKVLILRNGLTTEKDTLSATLLSAIPEQVAL